MALLCPLYSRTFFCQATNRTKTRPSLCRRSSTSRVHAGTLGDSLHAVSPTSPCGCPSKKGSSCMLKVRGENPPSSDWAVVPWLITQWQQRDSVEAWHLSVVFSPLRAKQLVVCPQCWCLYGRARRVCEAAAVLRWVWRSSHKQADKGMCAHDDPGHNENIQN